MMKVEMGGIPTFKLIPETTEEKLICDLLGGRFFRAYQTKSQPDYYAVSFTVTGGDIEVRPAYSRCGNAPIIEG